MRFDSTTRSSHEHEERGTEQSQRRATHDLSYLL
jgi:hypothetical protein